ncbi:MAG: phage tail tip lysozyme [Candidatus Pacearchaeota archaeon]
MNCFTKKEMIKFLLVSLIFVLLVFSFSFTSSQFTTGTGSDAFSGSSSYTYSTPQFSSYTTAQATINWPGYYGNTTQDWNTCRERQDFIVQIAPGGCKPAVVRSDLIAEQNVAVFCQLQGIQINPAIPVESIKSITFNQVGKYPEGMQGVGYYHPARLALSPYKTQQGFATLNNLGYVVLVLKQQPDERKLPEFVRGNLTATITYGIPNGIGMGLVQSDVPVLSDDKWKQIYPKYTFFQGRAFVRVDSLAKSSAKISVYSDVNHKIDSFTIEKGKTSERYLPGSYCQMAYQVSLVDLVSSGKKATVMFDQNQEDVYEGGKFAEGLCQITKLDISGENTGLVTGYCTSAAGGNKQFSLSIGAQGSSLLIDNDEKNPQVKDELYSYILPVTGTDTGDAPQGKVYFGAQGANSKIPFIVLIALKNEQILDENVMKQLNDYTTQLSASQSIQTKKDTLKIKDVEYSLGVVKQGESLADFFSKKVEFKNFVSPQTGISTDDGDFKNLFKSSIDQYKEVDTTYGNRKFYSAVEDDDTYGFRSISNAILLSNNVKESKTLLEMISLFKEKYPSKSLPQGIVDNANVDTSQDSQILDFNGEIHTIRVVSFENPVPEDNGGKLLVNDDIKSFTAAKEWVIEPGKTDSKPQTNLMVESFDSEKVNLIANCFDSTGKSTSEKAAITVGSDKVMCGNLKIQVKELHIQQNARIKIDLVSKRSGSTVNISYNIGFEKRAFPLTPEKTKEKISKLNETIAKWQKISDSLASAVKTMKAACFATSAVLQVKNLFANLGGKSIARNEVMRDSGGWNDMCSAALATEGKVAPEKYKNLMAPGPYNSLDDCFGKNSKAIESDVNILNSEINKVNEEIKKSEDSGGFVKSAGVLGGKAVDTEGARKAYVKELQTDLGKSSVAGVDEKGNKISVGEVLGTNLPLDMQYDQAREIRLYSNILSDDQASPTLRKLAETKLYSSLSTVKETGLKDAQAKSTADKLRTNGQFVGTPQVILPEAKKDQTKGVYDDFKLATDYTPSNNPTSKLDRATPIAPIFDSNGNQYYASLKEAGSGQYAIDRIFKVQSDGKMGEEVLSFSPEYKTIRSTYASFKKFDSQSYNTPIKDPLVKYFETEPYKGMPAIVPFDTAKGWYAATKQTLGGLGGSTSGTQAFQESGRVSSFWLCNAGPNGNIEFDSGVGDDICQMFNLNTGQTSNNFYGLSEADAQKKVADGIRALQQAAEQYSSGVQKVTILGKSIKVGNPANNKLGTQCQDFMSASDCKLMFNVCDPVICPASRCNLGGKFYVDDVVQSGIVGSIFLCLPNYKEGIVVPVCLTGVQAGVDNYISILKSYQSCLKENLNSGKYIGICDEITAIYTCEFFWRQAGPMLKVILPKLLEALAGTYRGGGEYLSVQAAWKNTESSVNYFTNFYGVNAMKAFNLRSTDEAGTTVCKAFVSTKFAKDFNALIEPDSPAQFSAWFDEIAQTTATIPATSQYKVFYHIYSGKDIGTYYSIYLKDAPGESYYQTTAYYPVATGYINKGEYAEEAKDFTAPGGFRQLCVRINEEEKCGFKQVSTSFAVNYLKDQYIKDQATTANVNSESECIGGTPSVLSAIQPNIQEGVQSVISPQIYQRGIIRICATDNPGGTTGDSSRWKDVGNCGTTKIRCWIDTQSLSSAFTAGNVGGLNSTIAELNALATNLSNQQKGLMEDSFAAATFIAIETDIQTKLTSLSTNGDLVEMKKDKEILLAKLNALGDSYILTDLQLARVGFDKALIYDALARKRYIDFQKTKVVTTPVIAAAKKTCYDLNGFWYSNAMSCADRGMLDYTSQASDKDTEPNSVCCVNKAAVTPVTPVTGPTLPLGDMKARSKTAWDYFTSQGYSNVQVAGIIGNLIVESSLSPTNAFNEANGLESYGLAQWNDGRRTNLNNFASSKGKSSSDFNTQLEFVNYELKGSGANGGSSEKTAYDSLIKTTTISDATKTFMNKYERPSSNPSVNLIDKRIAYANEVYNNFNSGSGSASSTNDVYSWATTLIFEYQDGTLAANVYYKFESGGWQYRSDAGAWLDVSSMTSKNSLQANLAKHDYDQGITDFVNELNKGKSSFFSTTPALKIYLHNPNRVQSFQIEGKAVSTLKSEIISFVGIQTDTISSSSTDSCTSNGGDWWITPCNELIQEGVTLTDISNLVSDTDKTKNPDKYCCSKTGSGSTTTPLTTAASVVPTADIYDLESDFKSYEFLDEVWQMSDDGIHWEEINQNNAESNLQKQLSTLNKDSQNVDSKYDEGIKDIASQVCDSSKAILEDNSLSEGDKMNQLPKLTISGKGKEKVALSCNFNYQELVQNILDSAVNLKAAANLPIFSTTTYDHVSCYFSFINHNWMFALVGTDRWKQISEVEAKKGIKECELTSSDDIILIDQLFAINNDKSQISDSVRMQEGITKFVDWSCHTVFSLEVHFFNENLKETSQKFFTCNNQEVDSNFISTYKSVLGFAGLKAASNQEEPSQCDNELYSIVNGEYCAALALDNIIGSYKSSTGVRWNLYKKPSIEVSTTLENCPPEDKPNQDHLAGTFYSSYGPDKLCNDESKIHVYSIVSSKNCQLGEKVAGTFLGSDAKTDYKVCYKLV